ncbi:BF3164 family lipoprotein [Flavivirga algicola]|uniref:TolB-like 6-blade propeller-like n=1 Tax=Flavivirga algicola TaxID=2729136 RepID=A0ABX1RXL7_9FLAO|nr:BF3164 family lipoprotein [Flavivirga algicola]NMH87538.1 hypothetical protein [Flavivirga algicola]
MKEIICLFIMSILIASCNNNRIKPDYIIEKFPKEVDLVSKKIQLASNTLNVNRVLVIDSFFVISQKRKDSMFSIFKLPSFNHLYSFGNKGNGPLEFNSASIQTFKPVHNETATFAMGNKMTNIQYYKIQDLLNKNITPYKISKLPPKLNSFRDIIYAKDSLIFGAPYGNNIDLFKYDNSESLLENFAEYLNDYPRMDSHTKREVYSCYMTIKPDNKKFVRTYSTMGRIEIFNISQNRKRPITLEYKYFPTLEKNLKINKLSKTDQPLDKTKVFSWGIKANNDYIFVQIYNADYNTFIKNNFPLESFIPEIHIFDWHGKPIARCKLDSHFDFFDVDKENSYLYTTSLFENNIIRRYDLTKLNSN